LSAPPPQLTPKAILLGIALSVVLAAANAYLGLFAGLTVSASIPAAVISMAVLRLFKHSNILESNVVQTAASAGESLAAGVIFTLPGLVILGYWSGFDYFWVSTIAGIGGLLGVLFTVPLRRSLIMERALPYPEGTATAEVLKVGTTSGRGARALALAAALGGAVKFAEAGLRIWPATVQAASHVGSTVAYVGMNLSPALLGVGYIVGLNVAALVFLGGAISWFVAIPIYAAFFLADDPALAAARDALADPAALAFAIWTAKIRFLGVGAMLVGGIGALIDMREALWSGIRTGLSQNPAYRGGGYDHTEHDAPMRFVLLGIGLFVIPMFALYYGIVGTLGVALALTLIMLVAGFLFSAVAAYMAGLVGSSNNPVSGITIATILCSSLLLLFMVGDMGPAGPAAAIMVGAVVCCAAAIGGDNLQDLKAGYLIGATPWRQQLMQVVGVVAAMFVMAPILNLLLAAYGIGAPTPQHPNALLAPQATLMASVAQGVFRGGLPWGMVVTGALIGLLVILLDHRQRVRGAKWRFPVLAVAVGIYLPLELAVPICMGGMLAHYAGRQRTARAAPQAAGQAGTLFAAGMITGEALVGIAIAIPIVVSGDADVLRLAFALPAMAGMLAFGLMAGLLYRAGTAAAGLEPGAR
jgi:putative OPT family oligopeptide transporter